MKKYLLLIQVLLLCFGVHADNIKTTYSKGVFHSSKSEIINADFTTCSLVIDSFISDLQTNPDNLFSWAFKDLGQTHKEDGSDDIVMTINHVSYDAYSAKSVLNIDLAMSNGLVLRNRELKSYVHDNLSNSNRTIEVEFYYSGSLLKKAIGVFQLLSIDDKQTKIALDIDIRFGWFFNIFITQKRYRNVMEWRIEQFIDNLKAEAEISEYRDNEITEITT